MANSFYLTLLIGPTLPVPAPAEVVDALTSAQVTVSADSRSGFQLSFTMGNRSLIATTLLPAGYFDPLIRVVLIVTVRGTPTVLMDGVITRQEVTASNDPGKATLTVTGEDLSALMDLSQETLPWPAGTAATRVTTILAKYLLFGIVPVVIPEIFPSISQPLEQFAWQTTTDYLFIRAAAAKNGYVFYIEPGKVPLTSFAYWGPEIRVGVPQPALSINMDDQTNVDSLSFSLDGESRVQKAILITIPGTKFAVPLPVPDVSLLSPPLAVRQAPALRYESVDDTTGKDPAEVTAEALAEQARSSADAVTGSGSLDVLRYGHVLQARRLVGVRGAGLAYDGLYFVKSVSTTISRGSFKQSFSLARNGLISITPVVPV